jgi:hypothetical protein
MKIHRLASLLSLLALGTTGSPAAQAAPLTRDLGEGLVFYRAETLPADLPTQDLKKKPCVFDLRFAKGDSAAAVVLDGWLKINASARTPVFLLVNADTDPTLLAPLASRLPSPGVIVIGTTSASLTPDIALKIAPADERKAYDALRHGAMIESLLNDSPEKARNDEARLAKDRQGANPDFPRPSDDPLDDADGDKAAKAKAPPIIDAALQRAVQLHRSLKALKRL